MLKKVPIAVLCSGGGTNLQAILDAEAAGDIPSGRVALVVSDNANAFALERAKKAGVETAVFDRKQVPDRKEREARILALLREKQIGLVILAGFMTILSENFTRAFENRIINVHPSLIPSFCGPGYYGLKVHEAALARGVKVTGATVHYVNEVCDGGPIILQKAVNVEEGDTPETLQKRVTDVVAAKRTLRVVRRSRTPRLQRLPLLFAKNLSAKSFLRVLRYEYSVI